MLLKSIIVDRPEDPLNYIIDKIKEQDADVSNEPVRRIFLFGSPGFDRTGVAQFMADGFKNFQNWKCIHLIEILKK